MQRSVVEFLEAVLPQSRDVYVSWQSTYSVEGSRFPTSDLRFARSTDGARIFEPAITIHGQVEVPASHTYYAAGLGSLVLLFVEWKGTKEQRRSVREISTFLEDVTPGCGFTTDDKGRLTGRSVKPGEGT